MLSRRHFFTRGFVGYLIARILMPLMGLAPIRAPGPAPGVETYSTVQSTNFEPFIVFWNDIETEFFVRWNGNNYPTVEDAKLAYDDIRRTA